MNIKPLTYDQVEHLINKYTFILDQENNRIQCKFNYLQNKVRYMPINNKSSILYFPEFVDRKKSPKLRWNYSIWPETKELFKNRKGQWNLILIQQLLSNLTIQGIDWKSLSNFDLDYEYKKIKAHYFIIKGGSI